MSMKGKQNYNHVQAFKDTALLRIKDILNTATYFMFHKYSTVIHLSLICNITLDLLFNIYFPCLHPG